MEIPNYDVDTKNKKNSNNVIHLCQMILSGC